MRVEQLREIDTFGLVLPCLKLGQYVYNYNRREEKKKQKKN